MKNEIIIDTYNRLHQAELRNTEKDASGAPLPAPVTEPVTERSPSFHDKISSDASLTPDGEEPTEEEKATLTHVGEALPASAWLVAVIEFCERFTYYGVSGIFQNYVQQPYDRSGGIPGALDMGHEAATGLTTFFQVDQVHLYRATCANHLSSFGVM